jgi:hypothetical protein
MSKLLTSAQDALTQFDAAATRAASIEAVLPQVERSSLGLWRALEPHRAKVKALVTTAGTHEAQGWGFWHQQGSLRLSSQHPSSLPLCVWYFEHPTTPALMVTGPDALTAAGPDAVSFAVYWEGDADRAVIAQGRRWVQQQRRDAFIPTAQAVEGSESPAAWTSLDTEITRPLVALTTAEERRDADQRLRAQMQSLPWSWPRECRGEEPRYDLQGPYLCRVAQDSEVISLAWSAGTHEGDSANPQITWPLRVVVSGERGEGGYALDEQTSRIYIVYYTEDARFWRHTRWLGARVAHNASMRRAVLISWIGAPSLKKHLWSFAAEVFRVWLKQATQAPDMQEDVAYREVEAETEEPEEDDEVEVSDEKAYSFNDRPMFESLSVDQRAQMLRYAFVFEGLRSTKAMLRDAPAFLQRHYNNKFQISIHFIKESVREALEFGLQEGYFEEIKQKGAHRRWRAVYRYFSDLTDDVLDSAIIIAINRDGALNIAQCARFVWNLLKDEAGMLARSVASFNVFSSIIGKRLTALVEETILQENDDDTFSF